MLVTGRFGLKSYSLANPAKPKLLDQITSQDLELTGDPPTDFTVSHAGRRPEVHVLAERGHGRRPDPQARAHLTRPALLPGLDEP